MLGRFVELIALEMPLIEVKMAAVSEAEIGAAGQHEWQVGIAVTVPVGHAASKQGHRGAQHRVSAEVLCLAQSCQEVTELFDRKRIVVCKLLHVALVAPVVAELMAGFGNANLGDGERIAFTAKAERGDSREVRLEGEQYQVVDSSELVACHRRSDVTIRPLAISF